MLPRLICATGAPRNHASIHSITLRLAPQADRYLPHASTLSIARKKRSAAPVGAGRRCSNGLTSRRRFLTMRRRTKKIASTMTMIKSDPTSTAINAANGIKYRRRAATATTVATILQEMTVGMMTHSDLATALKSEVKAPKATGPTPRKRTASSSFIAWCALSRACDIDWRKLFRRRIHGIVSLQASLPFLSLSDSWSSSSWRRSSQTAMEASFWHSLSATVHWC
mmetsp:Transcript_614/g.1256  ORF Transcript_614/g.1256 Transcript_614/m.1256 type:complete len:225 (-) Transcript_614:209-883(-)